MPIPGPSSVPGQPSKTRIGDSHRKKITTNEGAVQQPIAPSERTIRRSRQTCPLVLPYLTHPLG